MSLITETYLEGLDAYTVNFCRRSSDVDEERGDTTEINLAQNTLKNVLRAKDMITKLLDGLEMCKHLGPQGLFR